ncbi:hypothetical protein HJC23_011834 [Cyclotella cryptica]|uniref:U6 snRNA phosphodiesterase 1 n=1 Tax=Cyclotella cryptica TaxID=29204 RepID=A0ABD3QDN5_9STRA
MDHLLGYGSSPCSSPSQCSIPARDSLSASERQLVSTNCSTRRTRGNVTLLSSDGNASLLQDASNNHAGDGSDYHCSKGTTDIDGKRHMPLKRGADNDNKIYPNATGSIKRPKHDSASIPRVIIAGEHSNKDGDSKCNKNDEFTFERTHPHWEGRWAGHLFLPFPPLECLDTSDQISDNRVCLNEKNAREDESSDADSSADSDQTDQDGVLPDSRHFLPAARMLIHYWAFRIKESFQSNAKFDNGVITNLNDNKSHHQWNDEEGESAPVVIVPHIPMKADWMKQEENNLPRISDALCSKPQSNEEPSKPNRHLHVSLSRPIYLPAPSVDSFLSSISNSIKTVLSVSHPNPASKRHGRVFHLRPRDASIFTNDKQNRSFLTIPITGESAQWVKRALLPPINSTVRRFGQGSYYSEEGESCVLHVSVASVRGDMVKRMKEARSRYRGISGEKQSTIRSLSLFSRDQYACDTDPSEMQSTFNSIPTSIPIWLDKVQCQFGRAKEVSVKF